MYAWIWRKLPFGLPGKLIGSVLLLAATVALLWYVVFPAVSPYLPPYEDSQITQDDGTFGGPAAPGGSPGDHGDGSQPGDGHDIPYDTEQNNPEPTRTANR